MITFKVSNMRCIHCEKRINDALEAAGIKAKVNLESKTVQVAQEDEKKVAEILDDLGFDAEIVK